MRGDIYTSCDELPVEIRIGKWVFRKNEDLDNYDFWYSAWGVTPKGLSGKHDVCIKVAVAGRCDEWIARVDKKEIKDADGKVVIYQTPESAINVVMNMHFAFNAGKGGWEWSIFACDDEGNEDEFIESSRHPALGWHIDPKTYNKPEEAYLEGLAILKKNYARYGKYVLSVVSDIDVDNVFKKVLSVNGKIKEIG